MKILKMISLSLVLCFGLYAFTNVSKAANTITEEDPMQLSSNINDDITTNALGITEQDTTFWGKLKLNLDSIFTFDQAKKAKLELKKANVNLWIAKKLATNTNNAEYGKRFQKSLDKYKKRMANAENRIAKLPTNKKEIISKKINEYHLKQQQLLRDLSEKLPEQVKDKIVAVRKERIKAWYTHHKDKLQASLETATQAVDNGRPFQNLQIMATLEEMEDILPAEAQAKLHTVINKTQDRLSERLKNLNEKDQIKLDKYLERINIDEVKKIRLINNLDNDNLPNNLRNRIKNLQNNHLDNLQNKFKNLSDSEKKSFLHKNFETDKNGNATKIEILKRLEINTSPKLKEKIRAINEKQELHLKARIENTSNKNDLDKLEKRIKNMPALKKQIQDRKTNILKKQNLRKEKHPSTSNHQ